MSAAQFKLNPMQDLQRRVWAWCAELFAGRDWSSPRERSQRFLEEALELVQAAGLPREVAHRLVDYVYDRPVGEAAQEVGGTMVTLAALAQCLGIDAGAAGDTEMTRVEAPEVRERVKAKQAMKDQVGLGLTPTTEPAKGSGDSHKESLARFGAKLVDDIVNAVRSRKVVFRGSWTDLATDVIADVMPGTVDAFASTIETPEQAPATIGAVVDIAAERARHDRRRRLVIAGALIVAEIDRLDAAKEGAP